MSRPKNPPDLVDYADAVKQAASNTGSKLGQARDRLMPSARPLIAPSFQIGSDASVFTIGSCFARNIEEHLDLLGIKLPTLRFAARRDEWGGRPNGPLNKFMPATIWQEIAWAHGRLGSNAELGWDDIAHFMVDIGGDRVIDTHMAKFAPVTRERALERRRLVLDIYREAFRADVVVMTLGLIECWYDKETGAYIEEFPTLIPRGERDRFAMKILTFAESKAFIGDAIDLIRGENGKAKFILTTSPVHLHRTFTEKDILVANMHSKSVLRAVCGELSDERDHVDYFPSYESAALTRSWDIYETDLSHVTNAFVGEITGRMVEAYCSEVSPADQYFQRAKSLRTEGKADEALAVAEEGLAADPAHVGLMILVGRLIDDPERSAALLGQAIAAQDDNAEAHYALSMTLEALGRSAEAESAALRAASLADRNPRFLAHAWSILRARDQAERADALIESSLALRHPDPLFYMVLSERLSEGGAHALAVEAAELAVALSEVPIRPKRFQQNPAANLAAILTQAGRADEAQNFLLEAAEAHPREPLLQTLLFTFSRQHDHRQGMEIAAQRLVDFDPDDAEHQRKLAMAQRA